MELNLDELIDRVESTHKRYLEEKSKFSSEKENLLSQNEKLNNDISNLNNKINSLSNDNLSLSNEKNDLIKNIDNLKLEIENKNTNLKSLELDKENSINKINELSNKVNSLTEELSKKTSENLVNKKDVTKILDNDSSVYKELQNKYNDLQNNYESIIADLKDDLQNKVFKINVLNDDLLNEKNNYKDLINKTYNTIKHLVEDVIEPHELKIKNYESSLKELNLKLDNSNNEILSLKSQITKYNKEETTKNSEVEIRNTNLENFIESTIPVPKNTAAANIRQVKRNISDISEGTIPYKFGRTSKQVMDKVLSFIDGLFENVVKNTEDEYPLNNPLQVAENVKMDRNMLRITLERLTSMNYRNGKPLLIYKGNLYYALFDKDDIKNYISEN